MQNTCKWLLIEHSQSTFFLPISDFRYAETRRVVVWGSVVMWKQMLRYLITMQPLNCIKIGALSNSSPIINYCKSVSFIFKHGIEPCQLHQILLVLVCAIDFKASMAHLVLICVKMNENKLWDFQWATNSVSIYSSQKAMASEDLEYSIN